MPDQPNNATPFDSIVTPRSRRLRTTGVVLLLGLLAGAIYGSLVLMPALKITRDEYRTIQTKNRETAAPDETNRATERRLKRSVALKLITANVYWGFCGLLAVTIVFIAWLDVREVARSYSASRRTLWTNDHHEPPSSSNRTED